MYPSSPWLSNHWEDGVKRHPLHQQNWPSPGSEDWLIPRRNHPPPLSTSCHHPVERQCKPVAQPMPPPLPGLTEALYFYIFILYTIEPLVCLFVCMCFFFFCLFNCNFTPLHVTPQINIELRRACIRSARKKGKFPRNYIDVYVESRHSY